jgi:putative transcriptional regulator
MRLGMSQEAFARSFCFSVSAVREWEQGRRRPEAAARTLLRVIARDHQVVLDALAAPALR